MVGGTTRFHRKVIRREFSSGLWSSISLANKRCSHTAQEECRLTKPSLLSRGTRPIEGARGPNPVLV